MIKLKPKFNCEYQEVNVYGVPYCLMTEEVECPYLSAKKMNADVYSAVDGHKDLEFRVCEFKGVLEK